MKVYFEFILSLAPENSFKNGTYFITVTHMQEMPGSLQLLKGWHVFSCGKKIIFPTAKATSGRCKSCTGKDKVAPQLDEHPPQIFLKKDSRLRVAISVQIHQEMIK